METFLVSLTAVGKAAALACTGFYLHRRGLVPTAQAKEMLGRYSQHIGLPCLFFSKITGSDQTISANETTASAPVLGLLVLWPVYVVTCGLVLGHLLLATILDVPTVGGQRRAVLVAIAFANSTGLPTTLLSMMTTQTDDPTRFLSIYLIFYPILQWGVGGTLLGLDEPKTAEMNNIVHEKQQRPLKARSSSIQNRGQHDYDDDYDDGGNTESCTEEEDVALLESRNNSKNLTQADTNDFQAKDCESNTTPLCSFWSSARRGLGQPPVVGALTGWFIVAVPGFQALWTAGGALQWLWHAIHVVGQAAIPINMAVLGINLSMAFLSHPNETVTATDRKVLVCVTLGKLVLMPMIGLLSVYLLQLCLDVDSSIIMIMSLVFCTPTANAVVLITDLSQVLSPQTKQGMARILAAQYAVAPVLLSLWVMLTLHIAQA